MIKSIFSVIFHAIYGAVCAQLTHSPYDDCETMCALSSSNRKYDQFAIVQGYVMKQ